MKSISVSGLNLNYIGPLLSEGPKPTIFYFALSAQDSLLQDPYNQPVKCIDLEKYRVFSLDLPDHEPPKSPYDAIGSWVSSSQKDSMYLQHFFSNLKKAIETLIHQNLIDLSKLGFMGLSRGAFVASHMAALFESSIPIVGFSPLIKLSKVKEALEFDFSDVSLDLYSLTHRLMNKKIKFFIGNRDTRVHSNICAEFILTLSDYAVKHGIKSPPIELEIFPSIGYMGHGTPKNIFEAGSLYLMDKLNYE